MLLRQRLFFLLVMHGSLDPPIINGERFLLYYAQSFSSFPKNQRMNKKIIQRPFFWCSITIHFFNWKIENGSAFVIKIKSCLRIELSICWKVHPCIPFKIFNTLLGIVWTSCSCKVFSFYGPISVISQLAF